MIKPDIERAAQLLVERKINLRKRSDVRRALRQLEAVPPIIGTCLVRGYRDPYETFVTACMDAAKYERLKRLVAAHQEMRPSH
jgi:hypothetical protein